MVNAVLKGVEYALPQAVVSNADLAEMFPEWSVEKIGAKTGIHKRHIAAVDEYASDFAVLAAQNLFTHYNISAEEIDFILYCTQSPDYPLPTTACILQARLGCSKAVGALDFNLGCSGYVYGLALAKGLVETGQAQHVLLLTADTYSKYIQPTDKSVRTIFGDGASASWISRGASETAIFPAALGTNGEGAKHLMAHGSGLRKSDAAEIGLVMNGPEIFNFTLDVVPDIVEQALERSGLAEAQIDLYIFHQANAYMLEFLRKKLDIPASKFVLELGEFGNTVSSTIPIALTELLKKGRHCKYAMLVGFGVGYSWGAIVVDLEAVL
ncbi:MAG: ketoacyl-ACP synthase III [Legionellaceae bacterium]|nr:ketoacyl-ACP synthase III [Legionellaceae bacterium]